MIQIIDGEIVAYNLPETGYLKDGSSVSNYDSLGEDTLVDEGWVEVIDEKPELNYDTHELKENGYDISGDKAIKLYEVVKRSKSTNEITVTGLQDKIDELDALMKIILGDDDIE